MNPTVLAIASLVVIIGIGVWVRRSGKRQRLFNILIPCILIAVSMIFLILTFDFPRHEEAGPELIPRLWIYLIIVLSAIILWQVFRGKDKVAARIEKPGLLIFVMAALIGYFLAMPFLGLFFEHISFYRSAVVCTLVPEESAHLCDRRRLVSCFLPGVLQTSLYPASSWHL